MEGEVLITGGAGFIGAHTVISLVEAGFRPIMVDDLSRSSMRLVEGVAAITGKKIPFYQVDCNDAAAMGSVFQKHPGIGSVIHFAAFKSVNESVAHPLRYYRNNIGSLVVLLDLMQKHQVKKLVFSSSCTVYGQPDAIPVTEEAPFQKAESPYGATKQMGERILEDMVVSWPELKVISLRYFNPIGAHPSGLIGELPIGVPGNLVPFITQTAAGKRKELVVFGDDYQTRDGSCLRDFIHVMDLADAHVRALQSIEGMKNNIEAVNLGTGVPLSVLELIHTFEETTGVKLNYRIGPRRPGDVEKIYANPDKAHRLLQWKTKRSAADALRDAWNWEQKLGHAAH